MNRRSMSCQNKRESGGRRAAGGRGGFTLLEMLVAMVLLSIIMVLIYGSLSQISSGTASLNADLERQQETRLLLRMITDDLQGANYFDGFADSQDAQSGIIVSRQDHGAKRYSRALFHANVPVRFHRRIDRQGDPRIHELAYWVEPSEDNRDVFLLKRREDFYLDNDMEEGGISVTLAEGVEIFRIEVLAEPERSTTLDADWLEDWDSNGRKKAPLPAAIRVTLAMADAFGKKVTPESLEVNIETSTRGKP